MDLTLFKNEIQKQGALPVSTEKLQRMQQLVESRQQMLCDEGVQKKLSPLEYGIAVASTNTPLRLTDGTEVTDKVLKLAQGICKDVGITTWEDTGRMQYDWTRFLQIVNKYYSDFSIVDIKTAFELAAVGELDEYLPRDRNGEPDAKHYQNFSMEYYTKILTAYRKKRAGVWGKVQAALPKFEYKATKEQKDVMHKMIVQEIFEAYIAYQHGNQPNFVLSLYIKTLMDYGYIQELPVPKSIHYERGFKICMASKIISREDKKTISENYYKGVYTGPVQTEAEIFIYNRTIARIFDAWIKMEYEIIPKDNAEKESTNG